MSRATARVISPGTAASSARSSSISSSPTATGSSELGRGDLRPGQFGENFTIEGFADDEVCIGDRYRIGTAVFEVTQPRVTCYRVGIRMNDPRMPALLDSAPAGPASISVSSKKARSPGRRDREARGRCRAYDGRRGERSPRPTGSSTTATRVGPCESRRSATAGRHPSAPCSTQMRATATRVLRLGEPAPAWPGFRRLAVTAIEHDSYSVVSIGFEDPDCAVLPPARPGQDHRFGTEPRTPRGRCCGTTLSAERPCRLLQDRRQARAARRGERISAHSPGCWGPTTWLRRAAPSSSTRHMTRCS